MKTNTPEQTKAIKQFMANRKRQLNTVRRSYPKFVEGMSTARYIVLFYEQNGLGGVTNFFDVDRINTNPAAVLTGPEVIEEHLPF